MKVQNPKGCSVPYDNDGRYTEEMYRGNAPTCKGSQYIVNGVVKKLIAENPGHEVTFKVETK